MDQVTPGLLILLALAFVVGGVVLAIFCTVSIFAAWIAKAVFRQSNSRLTAFLGSAVLPMLSVLLFLFSFSFALEPDFRGPEIVGIAIIGMISALSVMVGWPVSYFVTRWFYSNRQ